MGTIYALDFPNGKRYIGVTENPSRVRYSQHKSLAKNGAKTALYRAWRKHGNPRMSVFGAEGCWTDRTQMYEMEASMVAMFGTMVPRGYNMTPGGEISPMKDPAIVERIAQKKRGIKHTPEARAKMSASRMGAAGPNAGKTFSSEWLANLATAQLGRKHSPETKAKMAKARAEYWARRRAHQNG